MLVPALLDRSEEIERGRELRAPTGGRPEPLRGLEQRGDFAEVKGDQDYARVFEQAVRPNQDNAPRPTLNRPNSSERRRVFEKIKLLIEREISLEHLVVHPNHGGSRARRSATESSSRSRKRSFRPSTIWRAELHKHSKGTELKISTVETSVGGRSACERGRSTGHPGSTSSIRSDQCPAESESNRPIAQARGRTVQTFAPGGRPHFCRPRVRGTRMSGHRRGPGCPRPEPLQLRLGQSETCSTWSASR